MADAGHAEGRYLVRILLDGKLLALKYANKPNSHLYPSNAAAAAGATSSLAIKRSSEASHAATYNIPLINSILSTGITRASTAANLANVANISNNPSYYSVQSYSKVEYEELMAINANNANNNTATSDNYQSTASNTIPPAANYLNLSSYNDYLNHNREKYNTFPYEVPDYTQGNNSAELETDKQLNADLKAYFSPPSWFSLDTIHENETRWMSEIIDHKSKLVKSQYRTVRNAIVQHYQIDPKRFLTFAAVRKLFEQETQSDDNVDVVLLHKVYSFLLRSAIININLQQAITNQPLLSHQTNQTQAILNQPLDPLANETRSVYPIILSKQVTFDKKQSHRSEIDDFLPNSSLGYLFNHNIDKGSLKELRQSLFYGPSNLHEQAIQSTKLNEMIESREGLVCTACKKSINLNNQYTDESPFHYYYLRHSVDTVYCSECYHRGNYSSLLVSRDFIRSAGDSEMDWDLNSSTRFNQMNSNINAEDMVEWNSEEILLLLEGLMLYGDSWENIVAHVRTKNKEQCITKFIQLPILDRFSNLFDNELIQVSNRDSDKSNNTTNEESKQNAMNVDSEDASTPSAASKSSNYIPFRDSVNPLMSLLSYLNHSISPTLAAAAAQGAIRKLTQLLSTQFQSNSFNINEPVHTPAGAGFIIKPSDDASFIRPDGIIVVKLEYGSVGYFHRSTVKQRNSEIYNLTKLSQSSVDPSELDELISSALSSASARALELQGEEDRKLIRCVAQLVQMEMKKVELKLSHLADLDKFSSNNNAAITTSLQQRIFERTAAQNSLNDRKHLQVNPASI
jgi:SWI/SNF related-matrix-associated actin-dependent regulator of chromatin subfamily C